MKKNKRIIEHVGQDKNISNGGILRQRMIIGTPTLGVIRMEWDLARRSMIIPINWGSGEIVRMHFPPSVVATGYTTADAQNVIAEEMLAGDYDWLLLLEDDVLPPPDAYLLLNEHIERADTPVLSGLYYSKGRPSWPLVFRGRNNGCFTNFAPGDQVWCDGIPTGFTLIHRSIIEWFNKNSPRYTLPDGKEVSQIFEAPRKRWFDPETDRYFFAMGTSDLYFCDRIMKEDVFSQTGWKKLAHKRYPFLCDTRIFCEQIDLQGGRYPGPDGIVVNGVRQPPQSSHLKGAHQWRSLPT